MTAVALVLAGTMLGVGVLRSTAGADAATPGATGTGTPHTAHTPSVSHARGAITGTHSPGTGTGTHTQGTAHTPSPSHAAGAGRGTGAGTGTGTATGTHSPGTAHTPSPSHARGTGTPAPTTGGTTNTGASGTSPDARFVQHLYTDMIGQQDVNGEAYWVSQLNSGMPRSQVTFAFTQTQNYANAVIEQLYQNIMKRTGAGDPGAAFWAGQLRGGESPERIAASMTSSPEWYANFGQGNDDTWIAACYQALLGRSDAGDPGAAYWHNFLATGGPRWQMTLDFVSGPEWASVTVRNMYSRFHLGTPDPGSLDYWSGQVLSGMPDDQLAARLVSSDQYYSWAQTH